MFVSISHCQGRYQQHTACGCIIVGRTEIIDMEEGDFEGECQGGLLKWENMLNKKSIKEVQY